MNKQLIAEIREQIQEDIITLLDQYHDTDAPPVDELCQIVVDNFKKFDGA